MIKNKNNFFIIKRVDNNSKIPSLIHFANRLIKKAGYNYTLTKGINPVNDMNTIEQRINFFHLLSSVIENNVEGDVAEFGCFTGQCAVLFQKILDFNQSGKSLHLYDSFEKKFSHTLASIEDILIQNFKAERVNLPVIHKGFFNETIPGQLPDKICFAHIDCGFGGDKFQHKEIVLFCLEHIYSRMAKGAVCVLMDYYDASIKTPGLDCNPGVKLACDDFLRNKPEEIISLYGKEIPHAYFKKV